MSATEEPQAELAAPIAAGDPPATGTAKTNQATPSPKAVDEIPLPPRTDTTYVVLTAGTETWLWEIVGNFTARDADAAKLAYCETVKDFKEATLVAVAAKFWKPSTVKAQTVTTTTLVLGDPS